MYTHIIRRDHMPLPLQNPFEPINPNTYRYDVSINTRISDGRLIADAHVQLYPVHCDENGVWQAVKELPKSKSISDIEALALEKPQYASLVSAAWEALNNLVNAINTDEKLI